ncbi:Ig-like domain-containing protein [Dyella sp. 20L07]|uniref:Ig-like domain-containing protein n=1 Tax=Dyella sp. 20L07 TaxID=3384240 RepID=UPI003D2C6C74
MNAEQIKVLVTDGSNVKKVVALKQGTVKIKAIHGAQYVLADKDTGFAPELVTVKRVGKDLHVFLEGSDGHAPELVITDYYGNDCGLIGLAENGSYYSYIPSDGETSLIIANLQDGATAAEALGGESLGFTGLMAAPGAAGLGLLGWAALSALGVLGVAAVASELNRGSNKPKPAPAPSPEIAEETPVSAIFGAVTDNVGIKQGQLHSGDVTDDSQPVITGHGQPGGTIAIIDNGKVIGQVIADGNGAWSFTPSTPLGDGSHVLEVAPVDKNGNIGKPTDSFDLLVDTIAPPKPDIGSIIDDVGSIVGPIAPGGVTDDTTPTINGSGQEPGDTVIIIDNGKPIGEVVVDENGNWSFTPSVPLAEGEHELSVVVQDPAGNTSEPSDPWLVIVDTTPPGKPSIGDVIDDVGSIVGPIAPGGVTDDTTPTINGSGQEPGDTVIIIDNGKPIGEVVVDENGNWSFTPSVPLAEGEHELSVVVQDPAGNTSEPSDPWLVIVDTTPPGKPSIGDVIDDVGSIVGTIPNGGATDDTTPTITGSGQEPGDKVIIMDNGKPIGDVVVDENGNWSFTPSVPLAEGEHELSVVVQDPAGNSSEPSDPWLVIVDTTPPGKPSIGDIVDDAGDIVGSIPNGGVTDDTTPTINGSGQEPGDTVIIIDNGKPIGDVVVDENGNWSFTPDVPLAEGEHELSVVVQDPAGNSSEPSDPWLVIVDTTPPAKPTIDSVYDDVGTVQGNLKPGDSTDDTMPTLSGKAEAGSTVIIYDGKTEIGRVPADANGNWTFTPSTPLSEGPHNLTVTATDAAGNTSVPSDAFPLTVDTTAPGAPTLDGVYDAVGDVQGFLQSGDTTDDTRPTLNGTAEANSTVVVYDNGKEIGRTTTGADGKWTFTPTKPLTNGGHDLYVTAVDAAGNASVPSNHFDLNVLAGSAPEAPAITAVIDDVGPIQGLLQKNAVTDDARPTINGTAEAGVTVSVYSNGVLLGTVEVGADKQWSFTPSADLAEGLNNITATATNATGNVSPETGVYPIIVDTIAPDLATGELYDDVGPIQGVIPHGGVTDDSRPTFKGDAEPGATVVIYDNGKEIGRAPVDADGHWSFTPSTPLADGPHSLNTSVIDPAGNQSGKSPAIDFTVDTSAVDITISNVMGPLHGQITLGSITNENTPTLNGKATANGIVLVYDDGKLLGSTQSNANGDWSFTLSAPLADGLHNLTATVSTPANGESNPTAVFNLTVDTAAPAMPSIDSAYDDVGSIQGIIAKGGSTDDTTPTLSGKAEAGSTVKVYDNGTGNLLGSVQADSNGNWSFTPQPLPDGDHSFTVTATDAAGNTSVPSDPYLVIVDTVPPAKPSIDSVYDDVGNVQGNLKPGDSTDDTMPTLSGKAEAGSTVIIYDGKTEIGRVPADANGNWTFTPSTPLNEGLHNLTVTATDAAGNTSVPSDAFPLTVDTTAPSAPIIDTVYDAVGDVQGNLKPGDTTDDTKPKVSGTAEANSTVVMYDNGKEIGRTTADANGKWTFTPNAELANGGHDLHVTAIDAAGNTSAPSNHFGFNVLSSGGAMDKPTIDTVYDDVGSVQGFLKPGDSTDDTMPTLSGKANANSTVKVYDDGKLLGTTQSNANGDWTYTPSTPLSEGPHNLTVTATDATGNTSVPSDAFPLTVDTTAPSAPTIDTVYDAVGDVQGNLHQGDTTDDTKPKVSGTAEANSTVVVYDNGKEIGRTTTDANGKWTFAPSKPLANGNHDLHAIAVDAAGNASVPSNHFGFDVLAGGAPEAPAITAVIDDVGPIQGLLQKNDVTDDARPTIEGSAEKGVTVSVYSNGVLLGTVVADDKGLWSFTPSKDLAEGLNNITATATNAAGNVSPETGVYPIIVDTIAPNLATGELYDDVGPIQGVIPHGGVTDDNTPTFKGDAEPGATVVIYDNGKEIGRAPVDADGKWSFTPSTPLSDGPHSLNTSVIDPAGNQSGKSPAIDFTVDTSAVAITITHVVDDVGPIQGNISKGGVTDDNTPTLHGKATANSTVSVYDDGKLLGTTQSNANGDWSFTPAPLADGLHNLTATVTTPANGESDPTTVFNLTVDTAAPAAPSIDSAYDDVGAIQGIIANGGSTDDTTPTLSGKAEAGSTVKVYDNGTGNLLGSVQADSNGNWSFTPQPLPDGDHSFTVTATDVAGNTSVPSDPYLVIVDTVPPAKPSIDSVYDDVGNVQGNLKPGDSTDDTMPTLSGKAEAGSTVIIYDGKTEIGRVPADANGKWTFTPSTPLVEGPHNLTVTATDAAGNTSVPSDAFPLTVDTIAPGAPTLDGVYDAVGDVQGFLQSGDTTDDTKPTLNGTAEANSTVVVYDNGKEIGRTTTDADGKWTFTPTKPLTNGGHDLYVTAVDAAGNASVPSNHFDLNVLSGGAPEAPAITAVIDDVGPIQGLLQKNDVTDDARPTIEGSAEKGVTVSVYSNGVLLGTVVADDKGLWSFTPSTDLAEGLNNITATATNAAGNVSPETGIYPIIVDTIAPNLATGELYDDVGPIQGVIPHGGVTDDNTPTFKGDAEPGATVVIYDNGKEIGRAPVDADGKWSFTPSTPLSDGPHSLNTSVIDPAGNQSGKSPAIDFTVDTSAVAITITHVVDDVGPIQGNISKGGVTDDNTPTLHGKATANSTVSVYDDGKLLGTTQSNANGDWSFTPSTPLSDGVHNLTATVTTPANGESDPTTVFNLTVDTAAPAAPSIVGSVKGQRWPQLNISSNSKAYAVGRSQAYDDYLRQPSIGAEIVTPVYDFGRLKKTINSYQHLADAGYQNYRHELNNSAAEVSNALIELVKNQILADVSQRYVDRLETLENMLADIVKVDTGRFSELTQAKARLLQAKANRDAIVARVSDQELVLRKYVGNASLPKITTESWGISKADVESLLPMLNGHPLVLKAQEETASSESNAAAVKASALPQLNWVVSKSTGKDAYGRSQPWETKLSLSWAAFRGGSARAQRQAALSRAEASREREAQQREDLEHQIRASVLDSGVLLDRADAFRELTDENERIRRAFFQQWYHLGRRTLLDVLGAENDYYNNQVNEVTSRMDGYRAIFTSHAGAGNLVNWLQAK